MTRDAQGSNQPARGAAPGQTGRLFDVLRATVMPRLDPAEREKLQRLLDGAQGEQRTLAELRRLLAGTSGDLRRHIAEHGLDGDIEQHN